MSTAIESNQAVGVIAGYYDEDLTIAYVREFFLHNLGYRMRLADGSYQWFKDKGEKMSSWPKAQE